MSDDLEHALDAVSLANALPADALTIIDRLRGTSSRSQWLAEAALRLARQQSGHDPQDPIGWHDLGPGISPRRLRLVPKLS